MLAVFRPVGASNDRTSIITDVEWDGIRIPAPLAPIRNVRYVRVLNIDSNARLFEQCGRVRRWPLYVREGIACEECSIPTMLRHGYDIQAVLAVFMLLVVLRQQEPNEIFSGLVIESAKNRSLDELARADTYFMDNQGIADDLQDDWYKIAYETIRNNREEGEIEALNEPLPEPLFVERAPARRDEGEEYDRYYSGTYVKSPKGWIYFDRMYDKTVARTHYLEEWELKSELTKVDDIDFTPLKNGIYNTDGSCVLVAKDPNRQWRRGVCRDTYKISSVVYDILGNIHENILNRKGLPKTAYLEFGLIDWESEKDIIKILNSFETNKHKPYNEALESIQKGQRLACAVNDKIWMMANVVKQGVLLFYKNTIVAEIDDDSIKIVSPAFNQEVIDFVRNNNCQLRIV